MGDQLGSGESKQSVGKRKGAEKNHQPDSLVLYASKILIRNPTNRPAIFVAGQDVINVKLAASEHKANNFRQKGVAKKTRGFVKSKHIKGLTKIGHFLQKPLLKPHKTLFQRVKHDENPQKILTKKDKN